MDYLARLNATYSANRSTQGPAITAKSTYGSFGSTQGMSNREGVVPSGSDKCGRWRVRFQDAHSIIVIFAPEVALSEVLGCYPGASVEPSEVLARRKATQSEVAELHQLIPLAFPGIGNLDTAEVLVVACGDPEAALTSFRLLAKGG